ncbi:unnamed protein product [Rotaria sp. Silwood2]|nr:unnamed protein product [Rotaria sp. Silwood2]CAF3203817.1 unnamed protein product [Rotaria sp. Silwood2]CAF4101603.1 unnamed protein product [Rotaria sp. Silwood2]CAF4309448.1 unnamed protein product [Rotaria sp. Silwood2]
MFAVPEVDDDIEISTPIETTKPITQPRATIEPPPPPTQTLSASLVEKVEKNSLKMQIPPIAPESVSSKQHHSRRSLFHRNTIHICDQIVDRM